MRVDIGGISIRVLACFLSQPTFDTVAKINSTLEKLAVRMDWLDYRPASLSLEVYTNWPQRLEAAASATAFEVIAAPQCGTIGESRHFVETYRPNPGHVLLVDCDLQSVFNNPGFAGNRVNATARTIYPFIYLAASEQEHEDITVSTFPYRNKERRGKWGHYTGADEYQKLSFEPCMPRGAMMISSDSKAVGCYPKWNKLEDYGRLLAERSAGGKTARSTAGVWKFHHSNDDLYEKDTLGNRQYNLEWLLNAKSLYAVYGMDCIGHGILLDQVEEAA